MSVSSSSCGAGRDILDLDRYVRGVRGGTGESGQGRGLNPESSSAASCHRTPSLDSGLSGTSTDSGEGGHRGHRSDCKTYQIIMSKLDDLGRMLATRDVTGHGRRGGEKIKYLMDRGVGSGGEASPRRERGGSCCVASAHLVHIEPKVKGVRANFVTESVVACSIPEESSERRRTGARISKQKCDGEPEAPNVDLSKKVSSVEVVRRMRTADQSFCARWRHLCHALRMCLAPILGAGELDD